MTCVIKVTLVQTHVSLTGFTYVVSWTVLPHLRGTRMAVLLLQFAFLLSCTLPFSSSQTGKCIIFTFKQRCIFPYCHSPETVSLVLASNGSSFCPGEVVLTIWCQVSDTQWAPVVSGVVDHHLRRVAAVPNNDSVAVYTEGCVHWSYPTDGDRGEGRMMVWLRGGNGGPWI